jgi:hypothetical protein
MCGDTGRESRGYPPPPLLYDLGEKWFGMLVLQGEVCAKIFHPLGLALRSSKGWGYGRRIGPWRRVWRRWRGRLRTEFGAWVRSFVLPVDNGDGKRPLAGSFWAVPA